MRLSSLALSLFLAGSVLAGPAGAFLQRRLETLAELADQTDDQSRSRFARQIEELFDLQAFANAVLVDLNISAAEETQLRGLLSTLVVSEMRLKLLDAGPLELSSEHSSDHGTIVTTSSEEVSIDFVMQPYLEGSFQVIDIITDDESLAKTYKYEINMLYTRGGIEDVITKLRKKIDQLDAEAAGGQD